MKLPESPHHQNQPKLSAEFYQKNTIYAYWHTCTALALFLMSLLAIADSRLSVIILGALGIGLVGYRFTIIIHDCSHQSLFKTSLENKIVGWLLSTLIFVSFSKFTREHWQHHNHFREDSDPQGSDYNQVPNTKKAVFRHLIQPLFFLNVIEKLTLFIFGQATSGGAKKEKRNLAKLLLLLIGIGIAQLGVFVLATHFGEHPFRYFIFMVSLVSIGLFLSRVRGFLEHGNLSDSDHGKPIARTHFSTPWESAILSPLNFNFHNEHHRWPQVPSWQLPKLHAHINQPEAQMTAQSFVNSLAHIHSQSS